MGLFKKFLISIVLFSSSNIFSYTDSDLDDTLPGRSIHTSSNETGVNTSESNDYSLSTDSIIYREYSIQKLVQWIRANDRLPKSNDFGGEVGNVGISFYKVKNSFQVDYIKDVFVLLLKTIENDPSYQDVTIIIKRDLDDVGFRYSTHELNTFLIQWIKQKQRLPEKNDFGYGKDKVGVHFETYLKRFGGSWVNIFLSLLESIKDNPEYSNVSDIIRASFENMPPKNIQKITLVQLREEVIKWIKKYHKIPTINDLVLLDQDNSSVSLDNFKFSSGTHLESILKNLLESIKDNPEYEDVVEVIENNLIHPSKEEVIEKISNWIQKNQKLPSIFDFGMDISELVGVPYHVVKEIFIQKDIKDIFSEILSIVKDNPDYIEVERILNENLSRAEDTYIKQELIYELVQWIQKHYKIPTSEDLKKDIDNVELLINTLATRFNTTIDGAFQVIFDSIKNNPEYDEVIDILKYYVVHPSKKLVIKKTAAWIETHGRLPKFKDFGKQDSKRVGISFYMFRQTFSKKNIKDIYTEILSIISDDPAYSKVKGIIMDNLESIRPKYNDKMLLDILVQWIRQHQRIPTTKDFGYGTDKIGIVMGTFQYHFSTSLESILKNVLEYIKDNPEYRDIYDMLNNYEIHPSEDFIINKLIQWTMAHNKLPGALDFGLGTPDKVGISWHSFRTAFSNKNLKEIYSDILSIISDDPKYLEAKSVVQKALHKVNGRYTDQRLNDMLIQWIKTNRRLPQARDFTAKKNGVGASVSTYQFHFGPTLYDIFKQLADSIKYNPNYSDVVTILEYYTTSPSRDLIIEKIVSWVLKNNKLPNSLDFNKKYPDDNSVGISLYALKQVFSDKSLKDIYTDILSIISRDPVYHDVKLIFEKELLKIKGRYTKHDLVDILIQWIRTNGKLPSTSDYRNKKYGVGVSLTTFYNRFNVSSLSGLYKQILSLIESKPEYSDVVEIIKKRMVVKYSKEEMIEILCDWIKSAKKLPTSYYFKPTSSGYIGFPIYYLKKTFSHNKIREVYLDVLKAIEDNPYYTEVVTILKNSLAQVFECKSMFTNSQPQVQVEL